MSDVEMVYPVPIDDADGWVAQEATGFLDDTGGDWFATLLAAERHSWPAIQHWGARSGGRWVGTLATEPLLLSVPGGADVTADGLIGVTVSATHRRRGLCRAMMDDSLRAGRDRGAAVSVLFAAEYTIYSRFGYAPATITCGYLLDTRRAGPIAPDPRGAVRQVTAAELGEIAPGVFERARRMRAGGVDRPLWWWESCLGLNGRPAFRAAGAATPVYVVHEGPGGPDGYAWWSVKRGHDGFGLSGRIEVGDLQAINLDAYRELWAYLAGIDLVSEVEIGFRPPDEPVRWALTDGRALAPDYSGDGMWLRLLDVPAALSARRYSCADRLVIEVVDPGGFAAGRFQLDGGPDGAECRPVPGAEPDLRLDARALAASYLGGFSLRQRAITGEVEELTAGAAQRFDAMFVTAVAPWCGTDF
ncbi:MAG: GNAT family N-acetyltransferase [Actinomycetia bacterium]|nr:GNAT family N-acetyltransferase [Actinomycetes bacterium]